EHVWLAGQQPQQLEPPPFATGQVTGGCPLGVATQSQPVEELAGRSRSLRGLEGAMYLGHGLPGGERGVQVSVGLPQVAQAHGLAAGDPPGHPKPTAGPGLAATIRLARMWTQTAAATTVSVHIRA